MLLALNSHRAAIIGVLAFLAGIATDPNSLNLIHILPAGAQEVISKISEFAGLALAYLGKPATVKNV